jgi:Ca2+-binding EF-hand superfamily protein
MKKFAIAVLLTLGVAMPVLPAHAEDNDWGWQIWGWGRGPGSGEMMGQGMMGPGMMGRMMGVVDDNGDGVISADEAASRVEAVFAAMDADDDGSLTEEEYMAVRMGPGFGLNQDRQADMQARKKERFAAIDPDKDGKVTQAEFLAAAQKRFAEADTDKDGKVTPWEFRAMRWQ